MNKTIKNLWVKALRSGKYKQGRSALCHGGPQGPCYCCLGVLSDLAVKQGVCSRREAFKYNGLLNDVVLNWASLHNDNPLDLSDINDNKKSNFLQIADLIQEKL